MERLTLRYIDPVTGENYHILFNPPLTQEIKDRLKQNSRDTEENVRLKLAEYSSTINEISEFYDDRAIYINADQDAKAVFETIEFGIVNQVLNKSN
jgi:adenylate kinase